MKMGSLFSYKHHTASLPLVSLIMGTNEDVDLDKALEVAVRAAKGAGELIAKTFRM
jgi:hypothetical protein